MERKKNYFDETDESLYIEKGELLQGIMMKNYVGDGPGGLVHTIWLDIGAEATCNFMTSAQRIVNNWLIINSFTMSCSDIVPSVDFEESVCKKLEQAERDYDSVLKKFQDEREIEKEQLHKAGKKIMDSFEVKVNNSFNQYRREVE